ncbi:MAG: TIGR00282 family metallophosphoesterase [Clostridia bacterium]|nr:TIGR00282 family metallophosphoesterase [Clostridia bacterium]
MKILAVGDIVGENGLNKLKEVLPNLKEDNKIDFIIVNGENVAGGMGITSKLFNEIINVGADVVTLGNHTWSKKDVFNIIDNPKLLRPANLPEGIVGKGYNIYNKNGKNICVISLLGRTDMGILSENPFIIADKIISKVKLISDLIIIDFHAEATAEKIAMGYYLDGKANIIFGTHTHVQTADETILPKGTAYITDIGMTGPMDSVIGMNKQASIKRFVTTLPEKYKLADGECKLNSCLFTINDENCRIEKINRINL